MYTQTVSVAAKKNGGEGKQGATAEDVARNRTTDRGDEVDMLSSGEPLRDGPGEPDDQRRDVERQEGGEWR